MINKKINCKICKKSLEKSKSFEFLYSKIKQSERIFSFDLPVTLKDIIENVKIQEEDPSTCNYLFVQNRKETLLKFYKFYSECDEMDHQIFFSIIDNFNLFCQLNLSLSLDIHEEDLIIISYCKLMKLNNQSQKEESLNCFLYKNSAIMEVFNNLPLVKNYFIEFVLFNTNEYYRLLSMIRSKKTKGIPKNCTYSCKLTDMVIILSLKIYTESIIDSIFQSNNNLLIYFSIFIYVLNELNDILGEDYHYSLSVITLLISFYGLNITNVLKIKNVLSFHYNSVFSTLRQV
jgi:hypothetical protein